VLMLSRVLMSSAANAAGPTTTLNPADKTSSLVLSNGNLTGTSGAGQGGARSVTSYSAGKKYFEVTVGTGPLAIALALSTYSVSSPTFPGAASADAIAWYSDDGTIYYNGALAFYSAYTTAGDKVGLAADFTNGKAYFRKNGVWQNSADPVAGTGGVTIAAGTYFALLYLSAGSKSGTANFGATAYQSAAPSGYGNW
jgi:hypothetical protein